MLIELLSVLALEPFFADAVAAVVILKLIAVFRDLTAFTKFIIGELMLHAF